jgi:hypothetical protein
VAGGKEMKPPNTKIQAREKQQTSNISSRLVVSALGAWMLELIWSLVFEAWSFEV